MKVRELKSVGMTKDNSYTCSIGTSSGSLPDYPSKRRNFLIEEEYTFKSRIGAWFRRNILRDKSWKTLR